MTKKTNADIITTLDEIVKIHADGRKQREEAEVELNKIENELKDKLVKGGELYDIETLYWTGYVYRQWHYYTGESSKDICKQAKAKTMRATYYPYHTMSVEMAIDRLKESYKEKKK